MHFTSHSARYVRCSRGGLGCQICEICATPDTERPRVLTWNVSWLASLQYLGPVSLTFGFVLPLGFATVGLIASVRTGPRCKCKIANFNVRINSMLVNWSLALFV